MLETRMLPLEIFNRIRPVGGVLPLSGPPPCFAVSRSAASPISFGGTGGLLPPRLRSLTRVLRPAVKPHRRRLHHETAHRRPFGEHHLRMRERHPGEVDGEDRLRL